MKLAAFFSLFIISILGYSQNNICQRTKQLLHTHASSENSNMRSDTIDILNYHIDLEIIDFSAKTISGFCTIDFTPKQNGVNTISLDLLSFTIDSTMQNGNGLTYSYNDTLLVVQLDGTYQSTDTASVTVYYHGAPQQDPSGWGGFYFQSGYAFNLGVGFESIPHNFGRAWFPCFDNFVERSTYSFNIKTAGGKVAVCNGMLMNETLISGDTISREWAIADPIPTYLACVAVCDYETVNQIHNGTNGPIPIELYAKASDTNAVKNSFTNLGGAIDAFENAYGPYRWQKVGYSMVPFSSGAMEHATNIAYPKSAANGSLTYETLMAHELSHHWWGDLATCHEAEEMWINEGMARYSEALFLEHQYGREEYNHDIDDNHLYVIRYPQHLEEDFWALDSVPLRYTYGDHVYLKGADVAHTLRGYLGDSLFFYGLTEFLENHQFVDVTSEEMMTDLSSITGVDLSDFFEGWVMNPGFPQFETRYFESSPNGSSFDVTVGISQKLKNAPNYFNNVPLDITFMDANWNIYTEKVTMSGHYMNFDLTIPFEPVYATVDFNNLISDAVTDDKIVVHSAGSYNLDHSLLTLIVEDAVDSAFLRVEHMWIAPDAFTTSGLKYELSSSRYYRIDGIIPDGFDARAQFQYDGRQTSGGGGWLDVDLVSVTEDSLHLFYRPNPQTDWSEYPYYTKDIQVIPNNAYGAIKIDSLLLGEYTLANDKYDAITSLGETTIRNNGVKIYPNPNNGNFTIELNETRDNQQQLLIYSTNGQLVDSAVIPSNTARFDFESNLPAGNYIFQLKENNTIRKGSFVIGN